MDTSRLQPTREKGDCPHLPVPNRPEGCSARAPTEGWSGTVPFFHRVCKVTDVPDPGMEIFEVGDRFIAMFHLDGSFYALDDRCTHDGGSLGRGRIEGFAIVCPRHGARFDIRNGRVLAMPAVTDTLSHEVTVEGDDVLVRLNDS